MLMRPKPSFYPPPLGPTRERATSKEVMLPPSPPFDVASVGFSFWRVWSQIEVNMKFPLPLPLPIRTLFVVLMNMNRNDFPKAFQFGTLTLSPLERTNYRVSHLISDASGRLNVTQVS